VDDVASEGCCQHFTKSVNASWVCGGDPVDMFRKSGATTAKDKKRRRHSGHLSQDVLGREQQLILDLPAITESYRIVKGQQLGILKLAIHQESRQRRAIFTLPKRSIIQALPANSNDRDEVMQHLQKLLKIDHVNILALHEACEDSRFVYLVYDWPEGGLLLNHLTQYHGDVTEGHVSSIFREVLAALSAAGRFNVYHHDWSLMGLFLGYKNRFSPVKLFGVGLAGVLIPLVTMRKTSRSNKHFYVSPELVEENYRSMRNSKKLHACDIWSVGTLLYMIFSGRPPFYGKHDEVIEKIKKRHWAFGAEFDMVSREAKDVIEKMLDKKWETRPSAADLLKHPFLGLEIGRKRQGGVICQDALSKLDQFARETHCKQTLARLLADLGLQESAYSDLEERFKQLDLDGNGVLEVAELEELAGQLNMDGATISSIIEACDRNDNQTIDISEFVSAVVLELESKDERLLVKAFDKMDMNRDARITKGEIFRILRQYSSSLETTDVSNFVADMDKDADQKIDYNEFKFLFPHVRERDEEIKARIRNIQLEKESRKKVWKTLLSTIDRFLKKLRTVAGKLALESAKLQKNGGNEAQIRATTKEFEKVLIEFAGRSESDVSRVDGIKERKSALTGLAVMNMYNREETAIDAALQRTGSKTPEKESSPGNSARSPRPAGSDSERVYDRGSGKQSVEVTGAGAVTIAQIYTARALQTKAGAAEIKKEALRRRKYLWLGMGEGIQYIRAHVYGLPIKGRDTTATGAVDNGQSPRSQGSGSSPRSFGSPRSLGSAGSPNDSPRSPGRSPIRGANNSSISSASGLMRQNMRTGNNANQQAEGDGEGGSENLEPWTTNQKKIKNAQMAMDLAAGPAETKLGKLVLEEQRNKLKRMACAQLAASQFHLEVSPHSDELCDTLNLVKHKCLRSWLPLVVFLQQEMRTSMDEHKVHLMERRAIHLGSVKLCVQLCERIMFSLVEFILWQEEGFGAMCSLEDVCQIPPATKRFLPFRRGEVEENARTPRDEQDAEELAPDEPELHDHQQGKTVSFAEGELTTSAAVLGSQTLHASGGASFMTSSRRLDRNFVRSTKAPKGGKGVSRGEHQTSKPSHVGENVGSKSSAV